MYIYLYVCAITTKANYLEFLATSQLINQVNVRSLEVTNINLYILYTVQAAFSTTCCHEKGSTVK